MADNTLPILRQENVQMIVESAPGAYNTNAISSQRCADFGKALLAKVEQGMTDELDKSCAEYIDKAKRTLRAMNERRAPVTKLFDEIRSQFTGMENLVDPTKKDSIPYQIQQARNAYATKKREEAERLRQEELRRQQREQAINRYRQDTENDYRRQFDAHINSEIDRLTALNRSLSLENYDMISTQIKSFNITLGNEWFQHCTTGVHRPFELSEGEAIEIRQGVLNFLSKQFKEQFTAEIGEYRDSIVDTLPSKKRELERMAQANEEEQQRIKAELAAREAAEARRIEDERRRKEEEVRAAKQVQQAASEMEGLFGQAAMAAPAYHPKTTVKKRVIAENADGILAIVSMWWNKEGQFLSVDELGKIFKKQITFCEKLANDKDNPELINSSFIRYAEEIKAK